MKDLFTFKRFEIKYLIDEEQMALVQEALDKYMVPDPHGESTICNIYYDTPDFRLIRTSLEKPKYKEKLRLRSYGQVEKDQKVFLELKKKFDGVVYKRRIELPAEDAENYMLDAKDNGNSLPEDSQIGREIAYFNKYYGTIVPAVHLSYDRSAYFSNEDPNLRITFDKNIRWRDWDLSLTSKPGGEPILKEGQYLMEVKTSTGLPIWLMEIISKGEMIKASLSKYGRAYETLLERKLAARNWDFRPMEMPSVMPHRKLGLALGSY